MAVPELPSKLVAEYTELANDYLDRIPVRRSEDIRTTELCLRHLLTTSRVETDSAELSDRVTSLKELLDHPELYVQHQENYDQYRAIIRNRITATIQAFATMSPQERNAYIENQREQREEAQRGQALLATATPPTGEARVLSQEEWLAEMQRQFAQEGVPPVLLAFGPQVVQQAAVAVLGPLEGRITTEQLEELTPELRTQILQSASDVYILMDRNATFDQIIGLDPELRTQILQSAIDVCLRLDAGENWDDIVASF